MMKNYLVKIPKRKNNRLLRLALLTAFTLVIFVDLEELAEKLSSIVMVSWGRRGRETGENKTNPHIEFATRFQAPWWTRESVLNIGLR